MLRQVLLSDHHPPALYHVENFNAFGKAFSSPAFPQPFPAFFLIMYVSVAAFLRIIRLPRSFPPDVLPYVIRITKTSNGQRTKFQDIFRGGRTPPPGNDIPYQKTVSLWVISGIACQPACPVWPQQHSHCVVSHAIVPFAWLPVEAASDCVFAHLFFCPAGGHATAILYATKT